MGLGKTVMTISLLLANPERAGSTCTQLTSQSSCESDELCQAIDTSPDPSKKAAKFQGFDKLVRKEHSLTNGGNLIVCPMTLLSQWKVYVLLKPFLILEATWVFMI